MNDAAGGITGSDPFEPMEMNLAAGGQIDQTIVLDKGIHYWDKDQAKYFNVQILGSTTFQRVTGLPPPTTPVEASVYAQFGYPFFQMWEEPTTVSGNFSTVRSIGEIDETIEPPLQPPNLVTISSRNMGSGVCFFSRNDSLPAFRPVEERERDLAESRVEQRPGPSMSFRCRPRQPFR